MSAVTVWEYYTTTDESQLDALGALGWELVAVLAASPAAQGGPPTFYFKRPAHDFRERVTLDQKRRYYALRGLEAGE